MNRWMASLSFLAVLIALVFGLGGASVVSAESPATPAKNDDTSRLVADNNAFAFDLYARLASEQGNLFLSPASISTALAMTYAGARGQTADEMARTLHFQVDQEHLHPACAALLRGWQGEGKKRAYQLSVANALWGQKGLGFLPAFLDLTHKNYGAGLVEIDFVGNPTLARKTINDWVEQQTQQKIKDLLQPAHITPFTRLVLTNAIYFKGDWARAFTKGMTTQQDFHVTPDQKVKVPLMHQRKSYNYLAGDDFQALELPYAGNELSMIVLLPRKLDGLAALEKTMTADRFATLARQLKPAQVDLFLPRFKMTKDFSLGTTLAAMGMPSAFSPERADFSGMTSEEKLFISHVIHKAFVDVNEEGTEAAAATAVILARPAAAPVHDFQTFRADHPFLFLIRDNQSGSILFLGRVSNPH
jgi:serpin B